MHSKVGLYRKTYLILYTVLKDYGSEYLNRLPVFRYARTITYWSSALDTSVIDNWEINNPTFDVVNDVNQDFSLKYSNNKMGINDVINKLSINNSTNLLH
jgi:hypothetical protein